MRVGKVRHILGGEIGDVKGDLSSIRNAGVLYF
jgi:hypothetical protein